MPVSRRTVRVDAGTPERLTEDCPACGWADLWQLALLMLAPEGVSTLGVVARCARCGYNRRRNRA